MKICVMSDLHGELPDAHEVAEITLICGDIIPLRIQRNKPQSQKWLETEFIYWVKNWSSEKVYLIAGNHDFVFENYMPNDEYKLYTLSDNKLVYLNGRTSVLYQDNEGNIYKIFGTPFCHEFGNWAFMYSDDKLKELYTSIPSECDILISHDAADINDLGLVPPNIWHPKNSENVGNKVLAEFIKKLKPKYYFCGHIHEGNHQVTEVDGTTMANVSLLNDSYKMVYEPLYLNI